MPFARKRPSASVRTPRPVFPMDPMTPAGEALRTCMAGLLDYARGQAALAVRRGGVEPVHDYRVALRILRALLSAFKRDLRRAPAGRLAVQLRRLAQATGTLRDYDVLLGGRQERVAWVSARHRKGLESLFDHLEAVRKEECARVVARLDGRAHARTMASVAAALGKLCLAGGLEQAPIGSRVAVALKRRQGKLRKRARSALKEPSDANLHALRIAGKKLRYLVETFRQALPASAVRTLLKRLKSIQDTLGHAQDLACQQEALMGVHAALPTDRPALADAAGRLLAAVRQARRAARREAIATVRSVVHERFGRNVDFPIRKLTPRPDLG